MDDGEIFFCVATLVVSCVLGFRWIRRVILIFAPRCSFATRCFLGAAPFAFAGTLAFALHRFATAEVGSSLGYVTLFSAAGLVTFFGTSGVVSLLGLEPITDAIERGNSVVLPAIGGVWAAILVINVGSNIGNGDTIATALIPLAGGSALCWVFLLLLSWMTGGINSISVGRLSVAGMRFGALALAASIPIARAAAGDWISLQATFTDLAKAMPSLGVFLALGWLTERLRPARKAISLFSLLIEGGGPSLVYLGMAGAMALGLTGGR